MPRLAFCLVPLVVLSLSCAHRAASVAGPGLNGQREANLRKTAGEVLQCPREDLNVAFVETIDRGTHLYRAEGCSKAYESFLACFAGTCIWYETPNKRAAFDLQCPADQLTRTYLGQGTFGVAGCGRSMTYLYVDGRLVANNGSH